MAKGQSNKPIIAGMVPIVVDLETGGVDAKRDAILEIAAYALCQDDQRHWVLGDLFHRHVLAQPTLRCQPEALAITGIIPDHPLRGAVAEAVMLSDFEAFVRTSVQQAGVLRGVLVGHNAHFDLGFLNEAQQRCDRRLPLHRFTCFDTATLGAFLENQSVLARLLPKAGMRYSKDKAHSALYDARVTAELFCHWLNQRP